MFQMEITTMKFFLAGAAAAALLAAAVTGPASAQSAGVGGAVGGAVNGAGSAVGAGVGAAGDVTASPTAPATPAPALPGATAGADASAGAVASSDTPLSTAKVADVKVGSQVTASNGSSLGTVTKINTDAQGKIASATIKDAATSKTKTVAASELSLNGNALRANGATSFGGLTALR
jgi:hypothetical protein